MAKSNCDSYEVTKEKEGGKVIAYRLRVFQGHNVLIDEMRDSKDSAHRYGSGYVHKGANFADITAI